MWVFLLIVLVVSFVYLKIIKPYSYWTNKGVKQRKQIYILGDNANIVRAKESMLDSLINIYKTFPDERYMGTYQFLLPALIIRDPDLIKQISVKDFDHFVDHKQFIAEDIDPLWNKNLVALTGDKWRDMRATLSPSFTSSKMKGIFTLISECAKQYCQYFLDKHQDVIELELKDTFTKYTNDVIATTAFGIKCDSLKDPNNEFYVRGRDAMNFMSFFRRMRFLAFTVVPRLCQFFKLTLFPKKLNDFFIRVVKETMELREEKGIVRQDMLQLLMEAKKGRAKQDDSKIGDTIDTGFATVNESQDLVGRKAVKQEITDLDIIAQALIFFFGGFESVATLLCFIGQELAINSQVQRKLQDEIDSTMKDCDGELTYEALMKMKYMDMVVSETLRKWPTAIATDRICTKPYTIPATKSTEKPVHLLKGDLIMFPIIGLHRDPQYFPKPDVFDPERFSDENKASIPPYAYIPFGAGPRNCIGSRFALLEIKTLFFNLLRDFDLVTVDKTVIPLEVTKKNFVLMPDGGFWVGLKARHIKI